MTEEDEAFEDLAKRQGYWGMQGSRKHQILRFTENVESKGTSMTQDEAREIANQFGSRMCDENGETHGEELYCFSLEDIIAIKEALAQPEQEPVAWLSTDSIGERHLCFDKPLDNDPVQPLYTAPPQRKPLTGEQISAIGAKIFPSTWNIRHLEFARAIEAAHDIKENT